MGAPKSFNTAREKVKLCSHFGRLRAHFLRRTGHIKHLEAQRRLALGAARSPSAQGQNGRCENGGEARGEREARYCRALRSLRCQRGHTQGPELGSPCRVLAGGGRGPGLLTGHRDFHVEKALLLTDYRAGALGDFCSRPSKRGCALFVSDNGGYSLILDIFGR